MGLLSKLFLRQPLLANTVSSGVLLAAGDGIQQCIEFRRGVHKETRYNWRRTGRMLVVGLLEGPPHYWWYTGLDRLLPGRTARVVRLKILADQLVAAPVFAFTFFVGVDLLEGRTFNDGLQEFKRKFPEVYLFDWCIWPPTQWLNFTYVPERYRVLYVNVVTVIWDVFLSYSKHRDQPAELEGEGATELALRQLRVAQISVAALDQTDTADGELLQSGQTDTADGELLQSGQTDTADGELLQSGQTDTADGELLQSGQTDTADGELLQSDQTDTADGGLLESNETDTSDCQRLESDQLGTTHQDGDRPEDCFWTADSGGTETRVVPEGHCGLDGHSEGLDDRLLSEGAVRAEPCRRRATS